MSFSEPSGVRLARSAACVAAGVILLTACSLGGLGGPYPGVPALSDPGSAQPYTGEVAAPQVAYRIDENRYFEIVPYGRGACTNAMVQFVDKAKGIRSDAVLLDPGSMGAATLIIDASNDQYLVAPVTRGNTDCSSGGGLCGGSKLPYSTDGGRTWKRASQAAYGGYNVYMSGNRVYNSGMHADMSMLDRGPVAWTDGLLSEFPKPVIAPLDTQLHCTPNGKE